MKPDAKFYVLNYGAMVRKTGFLQPDKRLDDEVIEREQREIEPVPSTVMIVKPIMTCQVEAVHDFNPP